MLLHALPNACKVLRIVKRAVEAAPCPDKEVPGFQKNQLAQQGSISPWHEVLLFEEYQITVSITLQ